MRRGSLCLLLLLTACAPALPPAEREAVAGASEGPPPFDPAETRRDLEASARAKFGDALTDQALASPAFLLAKHYFGLSPPPVLQPDGSYRYPDPPMGMLVRRNGGWLAARAGGGFVPVAPDKSAAIDAALRDPAFRNEPAYTRPDCTDAGASLVWLKMPDEPVRVRRGACGANRRTESLIFLALDA